MADSWRCLREAAAQALRADRATRLSARVASTWTEELDAPDAAVAGRKEGDESKRPTLLLDLDGTVLHGERRDDDEHECKEGDWYTFCVRPHAASFLAVAAAHFEVIVFTASAEAYARAAVAALHQDAGAPRLVSHVLSSAACTSVNTEFGTLAVKDVRAVDRDPDRVLLVDDMPHSAVTHPGNLLCVPRWCGEDAGDCVLQHLASVLPEIAAAPCIPALLAARKKGTAGTAGTAGLKTR